MRLRNYSPRTIKIYLSELKALSLFYQKSPRLVSRDEIKDFCYYLLHDKKRSPCTINQVISSWKFLQVDVLGHSWSSIKIKRPRMAKRLPQVLSQQEAYDLVHSPKNIKHRTLLMLTYCTGMRCDEVLSLKLTDIDSSRQVVRVLGKGNKMREVPLSIDMIKQLRFYYVHYLPSIYLFEGNKPGKKYSATSLRNIVKRSSKSVGIIKQVYPHMLRHSYATHMLERGINLKRLQLLMGHCNIKTTSGYLHLAHPYYGEVPNLLSLIESTNLMRHA